MGMAKEMRLSELAPGISARVTGVEGEKDLRRRVLDMGLVPGTEVQVQRRAPLGDPVSEGDSLVTLHGRSSSSLEAALAGLEGVFEISSEPVEPVVWVRRRLG